MRAGRIQRVDLVSAAFTLTLAIPSIYAASFPVVDTIVLLLCALAWPFAALLWGITLFVPSMPDSTNRAFSVIAAVLLALTALSLVFVGIFALPIAVLVASLTLTVYALVDRRGFRRVGWLFSPVIVVAVVLLLYTGIPRQVRFGLAEPQLTAFAEQTLQGQTLELPWYGGEAVSVAGISIFEAYESNGGLHLVTGYTGFLDDVGAGLAYMPYGPPADGEVYEHMDGPWYRWAPY